MSRGDRKPGTFDAKRGGFWVNHGRLQRSGMIGVNCGEAMKALLHGWTLDEAHFDGRHGFVVFWVEKPTEWVQSNAKL